MKPIKSIRDDRGTQLLEFAIILPMLVLMFFVVTEGTAMIRTHQVLNNAAREGARLASSAGNNIYSSNATTKTSARNEIISRVQNYVSTNMKNYDATKLTVTISDTPVEVANLYPPGTGASMKTTIVTVQYQYSLKYVPVFSQGLIANSFNLGAKAQFRNLW